MAERVQHLEQPGVTDEVASSYAFSPTGSSAADRREWPSSTSPSPHPSDNPVSPQGQSGSPRGEWRGYGSGPPRVGEGERGGGANVGGGGGGGGGGDGGGGREGWGGVPGKRHVDYEVHLKNPQVKTKRGSR